MVIKSSKLWAVLQGIVCVHKARDVSLAALKKILTSAICSNANAAVRTSEEQLPLIEMPIVEPHPKSQALVITGLRKQLDYTHHPLVVGEPFRKEDIRVEELNYMEPTSCGVCLFGINDGCDQLEAIRERAWVNEYRLFGQLGRETYKNEMRGKVIVKCSYDGITRYQMQKLLSRVQAQYKRISFELANVDLQSQEAFELARKGLPRPKILGTPVVYGISLNSFKAPHFSLTLSCVSETDSFLRNFVREIGICLGTTASCRRLRCARIGPFDSNHSLLDKHFTLKNIITNMRMCQKMIDRDETEMDKDIVKNRPHIAVSELIEDQYLECFENNSEEEVVEDCLRVAWGRDYTQV